MSKRKLLQLVEGGYVEGWNDPRMLTVSGLRRRGYTPASIREFCKEIGIGKRDSWIDMGVIENCIRNDLNPTVPRMMCVLDPIKVVITNYPEDQEEDVTAKIHPQYPEHGTKKIPFSREIYIERSDFLEDPPKKFFRLGPGKEVRLRYAYYITFESLVKDEETGEILEIHCTYDPESKGGSSPDGRKVKGTIHWVSAKHAVTCPVKLYDRLFSHENPDADKNVEFIEHLNPDSVQTLENCKGEPGIADLKPAQQIQFERQGYFCADSEEAKKGKLVFNRIVTLRDSWAKTQKKS